MRNRFVVLICGLFELVGVNSQTLYFKSEEEAHNVMAVNYPYVIDYEVLDLKKTYKQWLKDWKKGMDRVGQTPPCYKEWLENDYPLLINERGAK